MAMTPKFAALPRVLTALSVMRDAPVIPVIVLNDIAQAVPLARALVAGGIRMLEVTLRTPIALQCMERIAQEVPEAVVGAGTVRSPGFTPTVGNVCRDAGLALLPGVATGSEIMQAVEAGYQQLKFFPATQAGGPAMLKAWSGPFFDVQFCPTGGVNEANAKEFLALPNVVCVGGSWLMPADALATGDWARITALASAAAQLKA
jgi:2-dehydro-3-deoxyphosphogluconate aldolase / (4S)-4-hydroxy-2-oxoglutarate aldolase